MDALAQLNASLLGKYAIEREIGRGGMATVYLALDQRHERPVALKVMNHDLGAILGADRFLAEIRITAKLQHPNLLPLYDSGEADGLLFYVMPYVDGESLRAKLLREKQLPIDEAVHIATTVASALGYAHRHGVVHRDLKPENILLHDGRALVADFGIALAVSKAGGERITQTGVSLGTPQYVSPEQATGDRPIDGRTDIYSLGAVLYEMLTGDPPHSASTTQALVAKILTDVPPSARTTRPHLSPEIDAAVARALEKLPADRWNTAEEFAEALEHDRGVALPAGARTPGTIARGPFLTRQHRPGRRRWLRVALTLAVAIIAIGVAWRFIPRSSAQSVSFVLEPPTSEAGRTSIGDVAVSPDGQSLAFVVASDSASSAYVRRIDEVTSRRVPGTEGAVFLSFSPDAKWLSVATSDRRLVKAAVDGSSAITLAENYWVHGGATWESDQSLLLFGAGLKRIAATGGAIRQVTKPRSSLWTQGMSVVGADGETMVFQDHGPGFTEDDFLAIGSRVTGQYHTTSLLANRPLAIVYKHIVYVTATGAIMAVPFDARGQRITGDPVRIMEGLVYNVSNAAMSRTGTLVYRRGRWTSRLVLETPDRRAVTLSNVEAYLYWWSTPRFSPDGRRIAVSVQAPRGDTLTSDIWIFDVATRSFARLTSAGNVVEPEWTPDGRNLVFTTWFMRKPTVWSQAADGSQPPERVFEAPDGAGFYGANVTPDGRGVIFCGRGRVLADPTTLFFLPFAGERKPERIETSTVQRCGGRLSPDGKWWAYVTNDGQASNVYVRPYRRAGARLRVSTNGGGSALWSRDGKRLYYVREEAGDGSGSLFAAHLEITGGRVKVVRQERVTSIAAGGYYDIGPDGSVLRLEPTSGGVQIVVKTNWLPELRAKLK